MIWGILGASISLRSIDKGAEFTIEVKYSAFAESHNKPTSAINRRVH